MYKKIDFRVRPPYGYYQTMFREEQAHFARLADAFDMTVSRSQRTGRIEDFLEEMDEAGIELSVVPCRKNLGADGYELFELIDLFIRMGEIR